MNKQEQEAFEQKVLEGVRKSVEALLGAVLKRQDLLESEVDNILKHDVAERWHVDVRQDTRIGLVYGMVMTNPQPQPIRKPKP